MAGPLLRCISFSVLVLSRLLAVGVVDAVLHDEYDGLSLIQKTASVLPSREGRAEQVSFNVAPPMPALGPPGSASSSSPELTKSSQAADDVATSGGSGDAAKSFSGGQWASGAVADDADADGSEGSPDSAVGSTDVASRAARSQILPAYAGHVDMSKERIFLFVVTHAFHGSTALEGILMSSHRLATLCSSRVAQCEGGNLMQEHGSSKEAREWDFNEALSVFSNVWDVRRPVLLDKTPNLIHDVPKVHDGFKEANIPAPLHKQGVQRLLQVYVLMWRPSCLWTFSSHAKDEVKEKGKSSYAEKEMERYEGLVSTYEFLNREGIPALLLSLGDVIWKPRESVERLQEFLPQLGKLDADYVPEKGKDVWAENYWKAEGSVVSYGERMNAVDHGYDTDTAQCNPTHSVFHDSLSGDEMKRAFKAEAYLRLHS